MSVQGETGKRGFEKMDRLRETFDAKIDEARLDPLIPRFRLIDEETGQIITRFALDRVYATGEMITLPSIRIRMP